MLQSCILAIENLTILLWLHLPQFYFHLHSYFIRRSIIFICTLTSFAEVLFSFAHKIFAFFFCSVQHSLLAQFWSNIVFSTNSLSGGAESLQALVCFFVFVFFVVVFFTKNAFFSANFVRDAKESLHWLFSKLLFLYYLFFCFFSRTVYVHISIYSCCGMADTDMARWTLNVTVHHKNIAPPAVCIKKICKPVGYINNQRFSKGLHDLAVRDNASYLNQQYLRSVNTKAEQ